MKFKLLSGLLLSSILLSSASVFAQESTTTTAITDPAKLDIAKPAPAADTGSATKTKHHKKKAAAPAASKPQTDIESHQPAN